MKTKVKLKCPGCGFFTTVVIKKPDHFSKSLGSFVCSVCESDIFYTASKNTLEKNKVNVGMKVKTASKALQEMYAEEAADREVENG